MDKDMNSNESNANKSPSDPESQQKKRLQPMRVNAILELCGNEDEDSDNKNDESEDENDMDDCQPLCQDDDPINNKENPEMSAGPPKPLRVINELKSCSRESESKNSTSSTLENVPEPSNPIVKPRFSWQDFVLDKPRKSPVSKELFQKENSQENRRSTSVDSFTSDFVKMEIDASKKGVNVHKEESQSVQQSTNHQSFESTTLKNDKTIFKLSSYSNKLTKTIIDAPDTLNSGGENHMLGIGSYKPSSNIRTSGNFQKNHFATGNDSGESNPQDTPMKHQPIAGSMRPNPSTSHRTMFQTPQGKIPGDFCKETPASIFSSWKQNNLMHTPVQNRPRENVETKGNSFGRQDEGLWHRSTEKHVRRPLGESLASDRHSLVENQDHLQRMENSNYAINKKRSVLEPIADKPSESSGMNSELKEKLRPPICESAQMQKEFQSLENPQEQKALSTSEWPAPSLDYKKNSGKPQNHNNVQISVPSAAPLGQYGKRIRIKGKEYVMLGSIGQGMSGDVYRVQDLSDLEMRAIKYVNLARMDKDNAASSVEEINMLRKLQAPSVVKMFDYEIRNHAIYVVMEIGDVDLSRFLKSVSAEKRRLPLSMIFYYWTEMLTAVKHIHDNGVIHSDLKPANFLLVRGSLKLIDFGISSTLNGDMTSIVKSTTVGTLNYISPEALMDIGGAGDSPNHNNKYKISYKSDVWSLGCILYSLIFGNTPFQNIRQQWAKINAITNPNPKISFTLPPNMEYIPSILIDVTKKCLRHDPKTRPSVDQLLDIQYIPVTKRASNPPPELPTHILLQIQRTLPEHDWQTFTQVMEMLRNR